MIRLGCPFQLIVYKFAVQLGGAVIRWYACRSDTD
jgi:hypothetical protein